MMSHTKISVYCSDKQEIVIKICTLNPRLNIFVIVYIFLVYARDATTCCNNKGMQRKTEMHLLQLAFVCCTIVVVAVRIIVL